MELEEVIENIKRDIATPLSCGECTICNIEDLETILNHLTKQEKMIDLMAEDRMLPQGCRTLYNVFNKQDVINFYERLAEESE